MHSPAFPPHRQNPFKSFGLDPSPEMAALWDSCRLFAEPSVLPWERSRFKTAVTGSERR